MPLQNENIAIIFDDIADLLDIEGENPVRVRAYHVSDAAMKLLEHQLAVWEPLCESIMKIMMAGLRCPYQ